ncbi:MAG: acetyltransferase [Alphaproteobacteria bacterium]|nr:acetyltransferase [Alphaproteobacteria bacterium]
MAQQVIILGAGGHGRVCAEVAVRCGFAIVGFCDPARSLDQVVNDIPVIATDDEALLRAWPDGTQLFVAVGENARRVACGEFARRQGIALAILVDPSAIVSETAAIGAGSVVMANVVINANANIGAHCILNTACTIDHDGDLADGVQIGPGVRAAGDVTVGKQAMVGVGASLIPGVHVGHNSTIGAGAVVTTDVPDGVTVVGIPARPITR